MTSMQLRNYRFKLREQRKQNMLRHVENIDTEVKKKYHITSDQENK